MTGKCLACAVAYIALPAIFLAFGYLFFITDHPVAASFCVGMAVLFTLGATCRRYCISPEDAERWRQIDAAEARDAKERDA